LSASALPGLSPHCRIRLKDFGLKTVGQIAALPRTALVARFGTEGDRLYTYAHGSDPDSASSNLEDTVTDTSPGMNPDGSIEVALTLAHDVNDEKTLRSETRLLVDRLVDMLRQRRLACDAMTVVLTYADGRLVRRSLKWKEPTGAYIDLAARAEETLLGLYQRRVALKRIQLKVPRPRSESLQAGLFDDNSLLKQRALGEAITRIRKKNNFGVIFTASHTHNSK